MPEQTEDEKKLLLDAAIDKLDLRTLRHVLKDLCAASVDVRQLAADRLLVARPAVKHAADNDPQDTSAPNKRQKQEGSNKAQSRFEPCANCEKVFDVTKNTKTSCRFHKGNLELNQEAFEDDDEITYRPESIDVMTDWRRDEWPDGFIWDCCEENCENKGCVVREHVASNMPLTIDDNDDDEDEEEEEEGFESE